MTRALAVLILALLALPFGTAQPAAVPPVVRQTAAKTEPPAPATEPTFAEYDKALAVIKAFNESLKRRNLPPLDGAGIGKPGHSPVVKWGTGADFDRLSIDGVFSGPHLTGPAGAPGPPGPPAPAPVPPPTPPTPVDPSLVALQAAYDAETSAPKPQWKMALANLYHNAARTTGASFDGSLTTAGALFNRLVKDRQDAGIPDNDFLHIRQAIAAELKKAMPFTDAALLTDAIRLTAAGQFERIGKLLDGVK